MLPSLGISDSCASGYAWTHGYLSSQDFCLEWTMAIGCGYSVAMSEFIKSVLSVDSSDILEHNVPI